MRIEETHTHTPFELGDSWSSNPALRQSLARVLGDASQYPTLATHFSTLSRQIQAEVRPLAKLCDRPNTAPRLVQYDEWGQRVDRVETSEGWRGLTAWSVSHGMIGEGYGRDGQDVSEREDSAGGREKLGDLTRVFSFARIHLFSPDSRVNLCPTSMTDGTARVLELYGTSAQKEKYLHRLISRDPGVAWQAGQWMTERIGGSDIAMTETTAHPLVSRPKGAKAQAGDLFSINGFKWFSSAADGHASLALARTNPDRSLGSRGLSLFLIPLHKSNRPPIPAGVAYTDETAPTSPYNGIRIHRLKNKLGTTNVATAELELCGAVGELIGEEGRGVAQIASVLNITRIYSSVGSVSSIGRSLEVVRSYASKRVVGSNGKPTLLKDIPLYVDLLSRVSVIYRALLQLQWTTVHLLGKNEVATATRREQRRLRLFTPTLKAFAAYRATECLVQCIEAMGGQGYMSENLIGTLLRDVTVERIWEGTPSVLSLDVMRVIAQSKGAAVHEWIEDVHSSLQASRGTLKSHTPDEMVQRVLSTTSTITNTLAPSMWDGSGFDERVARVLLDLIAIITCGVELLAQAAWSASGTSPGVEYGDPAIELEVARRWICSEEGQLEVVLIKLRELNGQSKDPRVDSRIVFGEGDTPPLSKL